MKMKLQKGLGVIRKSKQEAILCTRILCTQDDRTVNVQSIFHAEPEKYYHSKLLLYIHGIMRMTSNQHLQLTMSIHE